MAKLELKSKAIQLRVVSNLSSKEIAKQLGVAKSTISVWLRQFPKKESEQQKKIRYQTIAQTRKRRTSQIIGDKSKFYKIVENLEPTRRHKSNIAESAILFRLALYDLQVYHSPFDCDKSDWVAQIGTQTFKLQVKCVKRSKYGLPYIPLTCAEGSRGTRRYTEGEFDYIIGYDLYSDTAYLYTFEETKGHKATITISLDSAERWDKITKYKLN